MKQCNLLFGGTGEFEVDSEGTGFGRVLFGYEGMMFGFYLEAEFFQFGCSRHGCGGYVDGVRGVGMGYGGRGPNHFSVLQWLPTKYCIEDLVADQLTIHSETRA